MILERSSSCSRPVRTSPSTTRSTIIWGSSGLKREVDVSVSRLSWSGPAVRYGE
jgi:hypothetical protein